MTTLSPESMVVGRFYKNGEWHIYRLNPSSIVNINGDPISLTLSSPEKLAPMRELLREIFDTATTDERCLRDQELQKALFHPNTNFQFGSDSVKIIGPDHQEWNLSKIAIKALKESSSGRKVETLTTHAGLFDDTLGNHAKKAFQVLNDRSSFFYNDALPVSTSLMSSPTYFGASLSAPQEILSYLPHLKLWCKGGFRKNPEAGRSINSFEQRLQMDYLAKQKEVAAQLEKEKDPLKQRELQEALRPEKFIKEQTDAFFKEIESQYPDKTSIPDDILETLNYLKESDHLLHRITSNWTEIVNPPSLNPTGLSSWTKYLTFQNIALGAVAAGAFYFLAPVAAATSVLASFLAFRQIDQIDKTVTNLEPLKFLKQIDPTLRKVATVALTGLTTIALASWIAPAKLVTALGVYYFGMEKNPLIQTFASKIPLLNRYPKIATTLVAATAIAFLTGFTPVVYVGAIASALVATTQTNFVSEHLSALPSIKDKFDKLSPAAKRLILLATTGLLAQIAGAYLIPTVVETLLSYSTGITRMIEPYIRSQFLPSLGWAGSIASTLLFPTYATAALALLPLAKELSGYLLQACPRLSQALDFAVTDKEGQKNLLSLLVGLGSMYLLPGKTVGFLTLFGLALSWSKNWFSGTTETKKLLKAAVASLLGTAAAYGLMQFYLFPFAQGLLWNHASNAITFTATWSTKLYSSLIPGSFLGKILLLPTALMAKQWIKENAPRLSSYLPKSLLPTSEKTSWLATALIWGTLFTYGSSFLTSSMAIASSASSLLSLSFVPSVLSTSVNTISTYYSADPTILILSMFTPGLYKLIHAYLFKAHAAEEPSLAQKFLPFLALFGALSLPFLSLASSSAAESYSAYVAPIIGSTIFKILSFALAIHAFRDKEASRLKKSLLALPFITMLIPYLAAFELSDLSTLRDFGGYSLLGTTLPPLLQGEWRQALAAVGPALRNPAKLVVNGIQSKISFWVLATLGGYLKNLVSSVLF